MTSVTYIEHRCDRCKTPVAKRYDDVLVPIERSAFVLKPLGILVQCPGCGRFVPLRLPLPAEDAVV